MEQENLALQRFHGDALVLWSPDNKVMPPAHGHRLAALMPRARYAEIPGAYVLSMLDEPEAVAREMGTFLTAAPAVTEPGQDQDRAGKGASSGQGQRCAI